MSELALRDVEEADRGKLLTVSYSKLEVFLNCKYRYKLRYEEHKFDNSKAIALNVGSVCHKVLELKAQMLMANQPVDYELLHTVLFQGFKEETPSGKKTKIRGIDDIKLWYFEDWLVPDNKSGMTYEEKINKFWLEVVKTEMEDAEWKVIGCEVPFEFVYRDKIIFHGFIDRIDQNKDGEIRVIDYKTSKAPYDEKKLATPLQMVIYGLACYLSYGRLPVEYLYRFVLINESQHGCTDGYLKRAITKLDKTFDAIDLCKSTNVYQPSPSPLCYYCPYCANNPNAESSLKNLCEYYSLWTPTDKTFAVNKQYNALTANKVERKLIF